MTSAFSSTRLFRSVCCCSGSLKPLNEASVLFNQIVQVCPLPSSGSLKPLDDVSVLFNQFIQVCLLLFWLSETVKRRVIVLLMFSQIVQVCLPLFFWLSETVKRHVIVLFSQIVQVCLPLFFWLSETVWRRQRSLQSECTGLPVAPLLDGSLKPLDDNLKQDDC